MSVQTLSELLFETVERRSKPDAFLVPRAGAYHAVSTREFAADVERASLGLAGAGIEPGDRVAILSENRYEWAVADLAILTASAVTVPVYPTLTPRQIEYVLRHSGARALFVSDRRQLETIAGLEPPASRIETVVVFDPIPPGAPNVEHLPLETLLARGEERRRSAPGEHRERAARVGPDDLATIVYTSGTSGTPKGVMLTHRNIVSNAEACLERLSVTAEDICLSFLPLSHVLERTGGQFAMLRAGATIAYTESIGRVLQNLAQVRPTMLIAVPRFYERTVQRIDDKIRSSPPVRRRLFLWARRTGLARAGRALAGRRVPWPLELRYRLADALVFRKVRAQFGGRIRFLVSGGAPLSREIAEFFFALGLPVLEGYGLTETAPVLTVNTLDAPRLGTAGRPLRDVEIAIADDGEILARGPNVMIGYHGDEEATRAVIRDGWLHTGDIGHLDPDGFLVITDRKKDLIVTASGKNVAPQPVETRIKTSSFVAEAVLVGDGRRFIAALLFPDFMALEGWAAEHGIRASRAELARDERVRALFQNEIARVNADLAGFEQIRRFALVPDELSVSGGELTPTLKVKRTVIAERYASLIEEMFARAR